MSNDRSLSARSRQVYVSGATGFVGQNLVPLLLENNYRVVAIARNRNKAAQFEWFNEVQFMELDFHKDRAQFKIENGAGLIHLAWQGLPNYRSLFHFEENLPFSYRFIKSLVQGGVRQVLVTGTCLEYGLKSGPIDSTTKPSPNTPYATAKDCLRRQLEFFSKEHPFCFQWTRLFYMYGKGQNSNSILAQLDSAINNNDAIFNMSGGEQLRDYLPIEEVAQQLFCLFHSHNSGIFNVCNGIPISIRRLVEEHIKKRNSSIKINLDHYPYLEYEPLAFWGVPDIDKNLLRSIFPSRSV